MANKERDKDEDEDEDKGEVRTSELVALGRRHHVCQTCSMRKGQSTLEGLCCGSQDQFPGSTYKPPLQCECVFSSGKETMSAHRSQIKYDLMEALQMLKFSICNGKLDFTVGSGQKSEL